MENPAYQVETSRVLSEMLDGETVIIDFKNGSYYSLNTVGSLLWELVQKGYTKAQIIQYFSGRYEAAPALMENSVSALLSQLVEFGLVREASGNVPEIEPFAGPKQAFFVPIMQQFQDMQEMLLADPIHDVDEAGWPTLKQ